MLQASMADPEKIADSSEFQRIAKSAADLEQTVSAYREYMDAQEQLKEAKQMLRECDGAPSQPAGSASQSNLIVLPPETPTHY